MTIADKIAVILAQNPNGLKASKIATQIGCTKQSVNSYLYSHKDLYEQHEGYIWISKSCKKNDRMTPSPKQGLVEKSCRECSRQNLENDENTSAPEQSKSIFADYWSDGSGISYYRLWKAKIYDSSYAYGVEWTENKGKTWLVLKSFSTEWEAEIYLRRCVSNNPNHRLWDED